MARALDLKRLRAKYAGKHLFPQPATIDAHRWAIFTAYCNHGLTSREIGRGAGISPSRVCSVVHEVDRQLETARTPAQGAKSVELDSPIEVLALSLRARNALRGHGCNSLRDVLRLDLLGARGIGRKTRSEVLAAMRNVSLPHPAWGEPLNPEVLSLDRSLERMHQRINSALEAVAKEITLVQKRLRKQMDPRDGGPAGRHTSA